MAACASAIGKGDGSERRREQLVLLERAVALVDEMRASSLRPDAPVWNALLMACGRACQLQRAFKVPPVSLALIPTQSDCGWNGI